MQKSSFKSSDKYFQLLEEYIMKVRDKVEGIILFGSLAKNQTLPFPKSDIDLIVIADNLPDIRERAEYVRKIEKSPSIVQSIWMTRGEFLEHVEAGSGYVLDAIFDGKLVFDRGSVNELVEKAKEIVKKKGIKRVGKCWVWNVKKAGEVFNF